MYFCLIYGIYFYVTWLPTYFREARGFTTAEAQWLTSGVLVAGGVATMSGGWLTDRLCRSHGKRVGRLIGVVAMPLSGLAMLTAAWAESPITAAVAMTLAAFFSDMCLSPSWSICHDIAAESAGTVTGAMNTMGNLGGAASPIVVGYCLAWWPGGWSTPLVLTAGVSILGGLLAFWINPDRRAFEEAPAPAAVATG
jgi:nitrate/nitrite transporter NarK